MPETTHVAVPSGTPTTYRVTEKPTAVSVACADAVPTATQKHAGRKHGDQDDFTENPSKNWTREHRESPLQGSTW